MTKMPDQVFTSHLLDFAIPLDSRVKIEENEKKKKKFKKDKRLDLAGELKKLKNMKVMVIPITVDMLGKETDGIKKREKELKPERPQYCWDQLEYWEEFWWPAVIYCHSDSSGISPADTNVKKSQGLLVITEYQPL